MNIKLLGFGLISLLVLATAFYVGLNLSNGEPPLGAVATLDGVDNPIVKINGETSWHGTVPMNAATSSVVCSFANPFQATSTVQFPIRVDVRQNGLGTQNLYISTSTTNAASSTIAWTSAMSITSAGQTSLVMFGNTATTAASTAGNTASLVDINVLPGVNPTSLASNYIIGPAERLNVKVATSTAGVFATYVSGTCTAEFKKVR